MEAEDRWRLALEAAGDGVWDWNLTDNTVYRSPRWWAMLGYTSAQACRNLEWRDLLHLGDRDEALRRLEACLAGATPKYEAEFRLLCRDGLYRWISARGTVVERDAAGNPLRFLGTHRDITAARERIERLRDSERLWQFALEGHGDALWDWSVVSGEIHLSPSFRTLIDWCEESPLRGSDVWPQRVHPDDLRKVTAAFEAHLKGLRALTEVDFRLLIEDGSYRWMSLRGKIMERDALGKPARMIGIVRDVHDHYLSIAREKRQEQELARAARLIHLGEMASALAHELNQPLTALRNFSAVALRRLDELGEAGERIRNPLQMISEQALRAGDIVHRVRGFVRRGELVAVPVAMNQVVCSVVRFAEFEARAHSVRLDLDLTEPLPYVHGDQVELEQVLSNLVKNAIDAMSTIEGERCLQIRTTVDMDGWVEVAVMDQGEGLDSAVRHDPFAPFASTKPEGVGLGLAICRTIIENHDGRLWVEKSDLAGTTFCFALPATDPPPSNDNTNKK